MWNAMALGSIKLASYAHIDKTKSNNIYGNIDMEINAR
jgi:hypothetical protein